MLAREKPHWGVSGVPFMKRTTGADATALSIAALVSEDKRRAWRVEGSGKAGERTGRRKVGRESGRKAWRVSALQIRQVNIESRLGYAHRGCSFG